MRPVVLAGFLFWSIHAIGQVGDQFRHSLQLGIHAAFFYSGELTGLGNYAEYGYSFSEHIAIVPRIMSATADQDLGSESIHLSALGGSLAARFTPFPEMCKAFKLDLGPIYQRVKSTTTRSEAIAGTQWSIASSVKEDRDHYFGAIGSLSFGVLQGERLGAGLRLEMIASFRERSLNREMLQGGIFLSVGF